jgi:hypothetical protein
MEPSNSKSGTGSHDIEMLVQHLVDDMKRGTSIAIGFEAPLFIPIPTDAANLSKARSGEGDRAFAAPAGLSVTTLALHQTAWLLGRLRAQIPEHYRLTLDWNEWGTKQTVLFLWEAFVSGPAHSTTDLADAATAAAAFCNAENDLDKWNAVTCERPLSLIGAAILWSGISEDLSLLKRRCLVIKPDTKIKCNIAAA